MRLKLEDKAKMTNDVKADLDNVTFQRLIEKIEVALLTYSYYLLTKNC